MGQAGLPRTRATSRTSSRGWPSRWRARRSAACCGSAGTRSGGSSNASSPTTSTSARLQGLVCIGVDEISYRRHHRYLTTVADHTHRRDRVVRAGPQQRHPAGLLRRARRPPSDSIRAVSIDMSGEYQRAIRDGRPATPRSALTPSTSSGSPPAPPTRSAATSGTATTAPTRPQGRWVKGTRWSLLKAPEHQSICQLATLAEVQRREPPALPRLPAARGTAAALPPARPRHWRPTHLDAWLAWATRSPLWLSHKGSDPSGRVKTIPGCRRTSWRVIASRSCCCRRACVSGCPRTTWRGV